MGDADLAVFCLVFFLVGVNVARLCNKSHQKKPQKKNTQSVVLHPIGVCRLNDREVDDSTKMRHNDTVRFGAAILFRFHHPAESAVRAKKTPGRRSLPTPGSKKARPKPPGTSRSSRKTPQPPPLVSAAGAPKRASLSPPVVVPPRAAVTVMPIASEDAPATATTGVATSPPRRPPRPDINAASEDAPVTATYGVATSPPRRPPRPDDDAAVAVVAVPAPTPPEPAYVADPAPEHLAAMAALRQQQVFSSLFQPGRCSV